MKKRYIFSSLIILTILFTFVSFSQQAMAFVTPYDDYKEYIPAALPGVKRHLRGLWVTTIQNLDWPCAETVKLSDQERIRLSKDELIAILDRAVSMNMNAVFFQVSPEGDALYYSDIVPWSRYLTGSFGKDPGFDPLAFIITEAHKRNLELHAWFNPYRVSVSTSSSVRQSLGIEKSVYQEHHEWIKTAAGRYVVDPGIPEARQWVIDRVMEVVRDYDVDGVHFDDYFYYESTSARLNDQKTYEKYNNGQFSDIGDWRRNNTYLLIQQLSEVIRAEKTWVKFGISPSGVWGDREKHPDGSNTTIGYTNYDTAYADTKKWVEEEIIDYIAPQIYYSFANTRASYGETARWWADVVKGKNVHLYIGQALYKINDDSDPYFKGANVLKEFPSQLKYNLVHPEISGSILFRAKNMTDTKKQLIISHVQERIWDKKALIPIMPWKGGSAPQKPVGGIAEKVAEGLKIQWLDTDPNTAYYAIYRFDQGQKVKTDINQIARNLIATVRKRSGDVQQYMDVQSENDGKVQYIVTSLDRLHHESEGIVIPTSQSAFFYDIGPEHEWAQSSIERMVEKNIIMGDGRGYFYPDEITRRADFILMVIRALGLKTEIIDNFDDVPADTWYYEGAGIAKALGIVPGNEKFFHPMDYITREEMMVILLKALAVTGYEFSLTEPEPVLSQFDDAVLISNDARLAVACLVKAGIIKGSNGKIAPKDYATRAEITVTLYRALNDLPAM